MFVLVIAGWVPSRAYAVEFPVIEFAVIDQISTIDALGRWKGVPETASAHVERGDNIIPAKVGFELVAGDRVVTADARVRVRLGVGQDISIDEQSDVEVAQRSVIQRLGDAYYRVRGAFSVTYGNVQTSVEGTEFTVAVGETTVVSVAEGRVAVTNGESEVHLRRGQVIEMPQAGPAPAPRFDPAVSRSAAARTFRRGAPTIQVGALVGGGLANEGLALEGRVFARLLLLPGVRLALDTGIGNDGSEEGLRLPQGLGVELALGGLSVGGQLVTTIETCNFECGGAYVALHIGGMGSVRYSFTLSRHFSLEGVVRAGFADGLVVDGAAGFGVSL